MTRELAVTLPLDAVESLLRSAHRLGKHYLRKPDREALELVEREVEAVKAMVGIPNHSEPPTATEEQGHDWQENGEGGQDNLSAG